MPDVITFGEAMIRLAPPNFRRLEQARSLDVQVGGAELNTAVGLARLGRSAAWVSRPVGLKRRTIHANANLGRVDFVENVIDGLGGERGAVFENDALGRFLGDDA